MAARLGFVLALAAGLPWVAAAGLFALGGRWDAVGASLAVAAICGAVAAICFRRHRNED